MENKFKKGDKVQIIGDTSSSSNKVGDIGIIQTVNHNWGTYYYDVLVEPGRIGTNSYEKDLELVEASPLTETIESTYEIY